MKTKVIPIGKSRGIRLPKALLDHCDLNDEIDVRVDGNKVILRAPTRSRRGWNEAFARMRERGHDRLLDIASQTPSSSWDDREWKW
jgi:antitoxin MazE